MKDYAVQRLLTLEEKLEEPERLGYLVQQKLFATLAAAKKYAATLSCKHVVAE